MFKTLKDMDFRGKRVLVRVDFNVPQDEQGNITDDSRIVKSLPTLKYILDHGASQLILMSHLGRPKGDKPEPQFMMDKAAQRLSNLMNMFVAKVEDCVVVQLPTPEQAKVVMLENLRFHKAEEANDEGFAKALAEHGDVYVNDAFGTCHRAHASVHAITKFLPSCAGLLVEKEVTVMGDAMTSPKRPLAAIVGFAKIGDKMKLLENLLSKVDMMLIGGAVAFTFLKSQGFNVGKSLVEDMHLSLAKSILQKYGSKIILPIDIVVANKPAEEAVAYIVSIHEIPEDRMGLDVGPETVEEFKKELKKAQTIIWNGPVGMFEIDKFAKASKDIALFLADEAEKSGKIVIVGGGDTAAAMDKFGVSDRMTHVSTGGGASLEFLEGKKLPGIQALEDNAEKFH